MVDNPTRKSGDIGEVRFPIKASVALALLVIAASIVFWEVPAWRDTLIFVGAGFAMAATVLSAYYIGKGLDVSIEQRNAAATADRIARGFRFLERWNDPSNGEARAHWRQIVEELRGQNVDKIEEMLSEKAKKAVVVDVFNFFEEMALAANDGLADDATLMGLFHTLMNEYHGIFEGWIKRHRAVKNRPRACIEFDKMLERWNKQPRGQ
jgi:hypothetical protein